MSHFKYLSAVKITTWNIRHGGGSRTEAIKAVLDEVQSSDVLVITEFRPNKNADVICAHLEATISLRNQSLVWWGWGR